jgi:hypothetical protein
MNLNHTVTYTYAGSNGTLQGRPAGFTSAAGSAIWSYDNGGRLAGVSDGTDTFTYVSGVRSTVGLALPGGVGRVYLGGDYECYR